MVDGHKRLQMCRVQADDFFLKRNFVKYATIRCETTTSILADLVCSIINPESNKVMFRVEIRKAFNIVDKTLYQSKF